MTTNTIANEYETAATNFLSRNGLKFRATLSDSKSPAWAKEGEETGHHYRVTISKTGGSLKPGSLVAVEFHNGPNPGVYLKTDRVHSVAGPFKNHSEAEDQRVILERKPARLVFDFWGSVADARKLKTATDALRDYNWRQELARLEWAEGTGKILPDLSTMQENVRAQYQREIDAATPSAYDVLACISSDAYTPETFTDFCAEYGYEADSIKALQSYRRRDRFAKRLQAFFTADELEQLSEIH